MCSNQTNVHQAIAIRMIVLNVNSSLLLGNECWHILTTISAKYRHQRSNRRRFSHHNVSESQVSNRISKYLDRNFMCGWGFAFPMFYNGILLFSRTDQEHLVSNMIIEFQKGEWSCWLSLFLCYFWTCFIRENGSFAVCFLSIFSKREEARLHQDRSSLFFWGEVAALSSHLKNVAAGEFR